MNVIVYIVQRVWKYFHGDFSKVVGLKNQYTTNYTNYSLYE